jgi:uncharacterized protein involved in high-affinity Fe2+ transport
MMRATADSDVHLEADVRATADNAQGFQEGSFVPYLNLSFVLKKQGSDTPISGDFHAMVANDGPHYGDNVKLQGPGKYTLTFSVLPPSGHASLGRHTDKETGVAPWFERCEVHYDSSTPASARKAATDAPCPVAGWPAAQWRGPGGAVAHL